MPATSLPAPATGPPASPHVSPDVSAPVNKSRSLPRSEPSPILLGRLSPTAKCEYMAGESKSAAAAGASTTAIIIVVIASLLLVASVLLFLLAPPPATRADGKGPPEPVELAIGIAGHEGWLAGLRAWAKLACLKLRPLEPRCDLWSPGSVKKAAKKSLEMGKGTVEHTAETAARAAEDTLEKTTAKVRRKVSSSARRAAGDL